MGLKAVVQSATPLTCFPKTKLKLNPEEKHLYKMGRSKRTGVVTTQ